MQALFRLPIIPEVTALSMGYVPISTTLRPEIEWELMHSMESNMQGIDAVWIDLSKRDLLRLQLGRKKRELDKFIPYKDDEPKPTRRTRGTKGRISNGRSKRRQS